MIVTRIPMDWNKLLTSLKVRFFSRHFVGEICFGVKYVLDKTLGETMFQKDPLYKFFLQSTQ